MPRKYLLDDLCSLFDEIDTVAVGYNLATRHATPLTPQQIKTVGALTLGGPTRSSDLAETLGVSRATVSGLLDRLEQAGCVTRTTDPRDARGRIAEVTPEGRRCLRDAFNSVSLMKDEIIAMLSEEDLRALIQGLGAVVKAVRARPLAL
ncbi:MAG: MarR family winged helix-turn-helix transcriptional regulator [Bifidobacteriaceae bacterium]|jgi:DNA-binding MarR family transcriptional regulator|nr:MarR family winged helix-turn-helix transcriptional regulator [Bifidobacteriaceae bacterium]